MSKILAALMALGSMLSGLLSGLLNKLKDFLKNFSIPKMFEDLKKFLKELGERFGNILTF